MALRLALLRNKPMMDTNGAFNDTLTNMSVAAAGAAGGTCAGAAGNAFTAGQTAPANPVVVRMVAS